MTLARLIRPADVRGDTNFDVILKAWLGHKLETLSPELKVMIERWSAADAMLRNSVGVMDPSDSKIKTKVYSNAAIVEFLCEKYQVSNRTAWEDIGNAKRFFLSCETRTDKEFARGVMIEWGKKLMWHYHDAGDGKAAAAFYKELNAIQDLHAQSADVPEYADFIPPQLVIVSDATELGFEKIENKDELVKRILGESMQQFIDSEAVDAEEE